MAIKHTTVKATGDIGQATDWNDDHVIDDDVDFDKHQLLQAVAEHRTTWPAGPIEGQIIYRTDQHTFYHWNGTIWVPLGPVATVVVAADGSGQTADIQEGIDMLPATGGSVYVKEGTYTIAVTLTFPNANISIIGAGKSTRVETGINMVMFDSNAKDGIVIKDLYIYGAGGGNNANQGILIEDSADCSVVRCWIENTGLQGIMVRGASARAIIIDNHIVDGFSHGIQVWENDKCVILGNIVTGHASSGIYILNSDYVNVTGNNFSDNGINGVKIDEVGVGLDSIANIVVSNVMLNNVTAPMNDQGTNTQIGHNVFGSNVTEEHTGVEMLGDLDCSTNDRFFLPASVADGAAPNNSVYFSTTQTKLVYKDAGGGINDLY